MTTQPPPLQDRPQFNRLAQELLRCGWVETPLELVEGPLFFQTFQGGREAPCQGFVSRKGARLLLIGLEPVELPADEELFPHFLNLPLVSRMALAMTRLLGAPDWLLLPTANRIELYRLPAELCAARSVTPREMEEELLPVLAALGQGREPGLNDGGSQLPEAESLRGWLRHWTMQLAAELRAEPRGVERLLWKFILMLQVARQADGSEGLGGWGLACARQEGRWTVAYDAASATEDLARAVETFDKRFVTHLFAYETQLHLDWLARLEDTTLPDRLRAELLMQTQSRFEAETVAWMFTDLAREQEGWRREVRGLEPIQRRLAHDGWTILRPLHCDVAGHGLTAALRDAERLARYLADLDLYAHQRGQTGLEGPIGQPDLFCPNPRGVGPDGLLADGVNYLYGEALRLAGVEPERRFGVGVSFLLKALALAPRMDWPFHSLDTLDCLFG